MGATYDADSAVSPPRAEVALCDCRGLGDGRWPTRVVAARHDRAVQQPPRLVERRRQGETASSRRRRGSAAARLPGPSGSCGIALRRGPRIDGLCTKLCPRSLAAFLAGLLLNVHLEQVEHGVDMPIDAGEEGFEIACQNAVGAPNEVGRAAVIEWVSHP